MASSLPNNAAQLRIVEKHHRFDLTTVFRVARLLRRERIEVVHAFLFDAEIMARLARLVTQIPVVIASERNADYVRPLHHRIAQRATRSLYDLMIANSNAGKRFNMRTLGLPEDRICVVHNGVDIDYFAPDRDAGHAFRKRLGIRPTTLVVGMIGSFKRQKRQDLFLYMAAAVRRHHPDTRFLLVGEPVRHEGPAGLRYHNEIRVLVDVLGLSDCCIFAGNQSNMREVYNSCDVTVLLSSREGTPNVVLESMACGTPVIASNVADNALIIADGSTGFVVPCDDPETAAARVCSILVDPVRRASLGQNARSRVCSEFSLDMTAGKLERIYRNQLARKRSSQTTAPEASPLAKQNHEER